MAQTTVIFYLKIEKSACSVVLHIVFTLQYGMFEKRLIFEKMFHTCIHFLLEKVTFIVSGFLPTLHCGLWLNNMIIIATFCSDPQMS